MRIFFLMLTFMGLVACGSSPPVDDNQPPPTNLPTAPNCAADGPDCKQFNPDLDKKKQTE